MTPIERYTPSEPSASAIAAFINTHAKQEGGFWKYPLHDAFAEDVPRIVRAECEAMLKACGREVSTHIFVGNLDAYLSARFGLTVKEPALGKTRAPDRQCSRCFREYHSGEVGSGVEYLCATCSADYVPLPWWAKPETLAFLRDVAAYLYEIRRKDSMPSALSFLAATDPDQEGT